MPAPLAFVRNVPFEKTAFGIDQDAILVGKPRREFFNVVQAWGRTLELQARRGGLEWSRVHLETLANAETGGAWFETIETDATETIVYRYVASDAGGSTWRSAERTLRHVNPRDYTGLAAVAYALIGPIRPHTIVDVQDGLIAAPQNPSGVLGLAFFDDDRLLLSNDLNEDGPSHEDFRTTVLHELGHLVQRDAYPDAATMMRELKAVFGSQLPLERSANCLMEHWGGLSPGNHFPYFEGAAREATLAIAAGRAYYSGEG